MAKKMIGNEYRNTILCIDGYDQGAFSGRICNPYLKQDEPFANLMQMLLKLDSLLDEMRFPQSFAAKRAFSPAGKTAQTGVDLPDVLEPGIKHGKCGTFAVRILYRQNASWQGSVHWLEAGRKESFRSALELIFLMNGALESGK